MNGEIGFVFEREVHYEQRFIASMEATKTKDQSKDNCEACRQAYKDPQFPILGL